MSAPDRRVSERQEVGIAVRIHAREVVERGELQSLSRLGGLIEAPKSHPVGTPWRLVLELPGDDLEVRCQVVRSVPSANGYAHGILFGPLPPATLARLDWVLEIVGRVQESCDPEGDPTPPVI